MWHWIDIPHACGGIRTEHCVLHGIDTRNVPHKTVTEEWDQVVETAPIFAWMKGRKFEAVCEWVAFKGGTIEQLP
jgi:hypothetical protein